MIARSGSSGRWDALDRPLLHLPRWAAALVLALLAAAMAWSAFASLPAGRQAPAPTVADPQPATAAATDRARGDMALYARIAARVAAGEGYYAAATAEHRASGYPTRPFVAVRLPTLARVQAAIGTEGVRGLALMLTAAGIAALWLRAVPLGSFPERLAASILLALGGGAAASPVAGYDHDFVAGLLLTVALLVWRPDRWWPALTAVAAALAVRELAAPFVLLWLAFACAEGRRREALALLALLCVFGLGMWPHFLAVDAARLPGDPASQGWNARAGFGLPLAALGELTGLRFLPPLLAAPLAIMPLAGWAGLGGRLGLFALLWFAGLAAMMALFARPANFYWIELALPAYALGLAFAPRALGELLRRAAGVSAR